MIKTIYHKNIKYDIYFKIVNEKVLTNNSLIYNGILEIIKNSSASIQVMKEMINAKKILNIEVYLIKVNNKDE